MTQVGAWRKSIRGRRNSQCKGPEAGPCLALLEEEAGGQCGWSVRNAEWEGVNHGWYQMLTD